MAIRIGSNIASLRGIRQLQDASNVLSRAYERLASGQRINRSGDDAAGLSISESLRADHRIYEQGVRNLNDGLSLLNIAQESLKGLSDVLVRQRELATQAANGVYTYEQRKVLEDEANALVKEYNRIVATTRFNGVELFTNTDEQSLRLQAGIGLDESLVLEIGDQLARTVGDGTFSSISGSAALSGVNSAHLADFNNDGFLDFIGQRNSGSAPYIALGNGDGTFAAQSTLSSYRTDMVVADFDGDGNMDFASVESTGSFRVRRGKGDGTFVTSQNRSLTHGGEFLDVGDFNGDGIRDVVAGGGNQISVQLGNGDGSFQGPVYSTGYGLSDVAAGDFNNDGFDDIVTRSGGVGNTVLALGDGTGAFGSATVIDGTFVRSIKVADFDFDGNLDILAGHAGNSRYYSGNGDGTVDSGVTFGSTGVGSDNSMALADFNNDGYLDVAMANESANRISVLLNDQNGSFAVSSKTILASVVGALAAGDLNSDGVTDVLVATNDVPSSMGVMLGNTVKDASIARLSMSTQEEARDAMEVIDAGLVRINDELGAIGALQSRAEISVRNIKTKSLELLSASGQIANADVAKESAHIAASTIKQNVASAVLSQANLQPQIALQLLNF